jgi:hypothetical protein
LAGTHSTLHTSAAASNASTAVSPLGSSLEHLDGGLDTSTAASQQPQHFDSGLDISTAASTLRRRLERLNSNLNTSTAALTPRQRLCTSTAALTP